MIIIDNIIVSDDIREASFCCDLAKCHGACCVEGDAGAPLEEEEISMLEDYIDEIKPFMREECIETVEKTGVFDYDAAGEYVTPLLNDNECVFVYFENNIVKCAIEKAYEEGAIKFQKPVSCHLYPIRISKKKNFEAVNYHQWNICRPAIKNGTIIGLKLYQFLKDPLIRKYGEEWYHKLVAEIEK
jgi:hypothetical protein